MGSDRNIQIAAALSVNRYSLEQAVKECSVKIKSQIKTGFIDFCLVFFSLPKISLDLPGEIKRILNPASIAGISSPYLIYNGEILKYGIIIIGFSGINPVVYSLTNIDQQTSAEIEENSRKALKGVLRHKMFSLMLFSNTAVNNNALIEGSQRMLGKSFPILGVSAARKNFTALQPLLTNYQIHNSYLLKNSAVNAIFRNPTIDYHYSIRHGFNPIGKTAYITEKEKNVIKTINGIPAASFYLRYFESNDSPKAADLREKLFMLYPLGIETADSQKILIRRPIRITPDKSLVLSGGIPSDRVRIMISTRQSLISAAGESAETAMQKVNNPKIAIVFDSVSRFKILGAEYKKELLELKSKLGNIPYAGILSHCQLALLESAEPRGSMYVQEHNICTLVIGEHKNARYFFKK